jgi:O-antigen ligase
MSYATILAAAFILWLPVALFGTQGYSSLVGLTAIAAAFYIRWTRINLLVIALAALAVWAATSSIWSAVSQSVLVGDLSEGTFNMEAAGLRIVLTLFASILTFAAALRIKPGRYRVALTIIGVMLAVHGALTFAMALLPETALDAYAPFSDRTKEAPLNILRSANAFLLGLPILLGLLMMIGGRARWPIAIVLLVTSLVAFSALGSDVSVLGIVLISAALTTTALFARSGFKLLLIAISVFILASPLILGVGGGALAKAGLPLPTSFQSRLWAWQLTTEKVAERPVLGHGIEASKDWRETFGDHPDLLKQIVADTGINDGRWEYYRILPGHPHNMGLQLWAETGLVGVSLAVLCLLLIAWKLPPPGRLPLVSRIATAALIGASFALFSLSYSVWNEAFWGTIGIAAAGIVLLHRANQPQ